MAAVDWTTVSAPSSEDLAALAEAARERFPEPFLTPARAVVIQVVEIAERDILKDLEIDDPFGLTGLYDGIPLTERSIADQPSQPDTVWLFRRAILDEWAARGEVTLGDLIQHIVVHELAHHFGWSDADIALVDQWWE